MPIRPAPGLVVAGRFQLRGVIGRGGMGSVWLATHLGLDVPCAVKFIEGDAADAPEIQARFEREAKAAAQLRSPHVVQIFDHGVWEQTPYIAMELLEGEDLGKRLGRVGRLRPQEIVTVVAQVCRALTRAHSLGIVHRDLKPDNVFLVRDDDREIAKVLDFGIAKGSGALSAGASTRTGAMLGTPFYMSPEQAQGTRAVDARSDLWSLAVIVFEALTGRRPFESEALGDLLMRILVGAAPVPSQINGELPPAFDAWWARASQRDPAKRYQSAKELSDALAAVFAPEGADVDGPARPRDGSFSSLPAPDPPRPAGGAVVAEAKADTLTAGPLVRTFRGHPVYRTRLALALGAGVLGLAGATAAVVATTSRGKRIEPRAATSAPASARAASSGDATARAASSAVVPGETAAPDAAALVEDRADAGETSADPVSSPARSPKIPPSPSPAAAPSPPPARTPRVETPATAPGTKPPPPPSARKRPESRKSPVDLGI